MYLEKNNEDGMRATYAGPLEKAIAAAVETVEQNKPFEVLGLTVGI
jgi:hypothetical protein